MTCDMYDIFRYNKEEIFDIFTAKSLDHDWNYCLVKLLVSKIIVENKCMSRKMLLEICFYKLVLIKYFVFAL